LGATISAGPDLITPEQLAAKLQLKIGTIYNRLAHLDREHGVHHLSSKCTRIDWLVFWSKLKAGEITFGRPR